jgi:fatty acid desaturase
MQQTVDAGLETPVDVRSGRTRPASDYAELMAQVRGAGLLDRSWVRYIPRVLVLVAMIAAGMVVFVRLGESWWQLAVAAYFAVVFAQLGFLGHDAGHQQVFRNKRLNDGFGLMISNLGTGFSYSWWMDKHTKHHRNPNDVTRDPDVRKNVIAWTPEQYASQKGVLRWISKHQATIYAPLLLLEAFNLHLGSILVLMANPRKRILEIVLMTLHVAGGLTILFFVMGPWQALAFVAVQQSLLGVYLGASFAPNHKGMQILDGGASPDFLRRQVLTSRNVTGGRALAVAFGGLNYQIEHHLFPSMPSRNLSRCRPLVKTFCTDRGVAYCETNLGDSYAQVFRYLRGVGRGH